MDDYDGYLISTKITTILDNSFVGNLYPGDIPDKKKVLPDFRSSAQGMVKVGAAPIIADFRLPDMDAVARPDPIKTSDDFREITPSVRVVRVDIPLQGEFTPSELSTVKSYSGTILTGLAANAEFAGVISGGNQTEIQYVYRTVGSPRRYPLDISWSKARAEEAIIIDEVDGDVDE